MSFASYLRARLGALVLAFACSWSAVLVAGRGFFGTHDQGWFPWVSLVMCLVLTALLVSIAYTRKTTVLGGVGYALLVAALVVAGYLRSTHGGSILDDAVGDYGLAMLLICGLTTLCFVLTRRVPTSILWFFIVALACSVVQAFYRSGLVAPSLAACALALAQVLHCSYDQGLLKADIASATSHLGTFASSVLPVLAAAAVAVLVWVAIIAPLDPGVLDVKLFTDYRTLPVVELKGTAEVNPVYDTSMTSENLQSGERYGTDDLKTDDSATDVLDARTLKEYQEQQSAQQGSTGGGNSAGERDTLKQESTQKEFEAQDYSDEFPWAAVWVLLALLLVALIAVLIVLLRKRRTLRLQRFCDCSPREQVANIYLFCLRRLRRMGFKCPPGMTLSEFAWGNARRMDVICDECGVGFEDVTGTYLECCAYGVREPSRDELVALVAFYYGMWPGARAYLGRLRYLLKGMWL